MDIIGRSYMLITPGSERVKQTFSTKWTPSTKRTLKKVLRVST